MIKTTTTRSFRCTTILEVLLSIFLLGS